MSSVISRRDGSIALRRIIILIGLTLGALVLTASPARADSDADKSRAHFKSGLDLAKMGNFKESRDEFLAAYKLYPHDSILLNLGIARYRVGEFVDAEQDLMRYLSDYAAATPEEEASARATLADVRGHLGTLRLRVLPASAHVRIDQRSVILHPGEQTEVRVLIGTHTVYAEAENFTGTNTHVDVGTGAPATLEMKLEPLPAGERAAHNLELPAAGMVLIGVSLASVALGTFSGIHAVNLSNQYSSDHDGGVRDEGMVFRTMADVSIGIAIVSAGVGAYLIFDKRTQTKVGLGPDGRIHF
jgi:hypothetical protein